MREATTDEARQIRERELRLFGATINPCQSIPPRHSPFTTSDGHTFCTRCGEDITPADRS